METRAREKAFQLFIKHIHFVESVAFRMAPIRSVQEDIVQDACVDFVAKAEKWDLDQNVTPLLRTITRNIALQYWREYLRTLPNVIQDIYEIASPESLKTQEDTGDYFTDASYESKVSALTTCLEKLGPKSRALIEQYYYDELTSEELGAEQGQKGGTIRKTICRLRIALRDCIINVLKVMVANDF